MNDQSRHERLRRMLRETDPAAAESGLASEEIREMRRTVLRAIPEPRRRFALSPALAGVAMAALVAILVLMMWPRSESTTPAPRATSRIVVQKSPSLRPDMNVRATDGVPSGTPRSRVPDGTTVGSPAASAPGGKARSKEPDRIAAKEEEPSTRQIQFDTPGGTRVIWVLRSDNAL